MGSATLHAGVMKTARDAAPMQKDQRRDGRFVKAVSGSAAVMTSAYQAPSSILQKDARAPCAAYRISLQQMCSKKRTRGAMNPGYRGEALIKRIIEQIAG